MPRRRGTRTRRRRARGPRPTRAWAPAARIGAWKYQMSPSGMVITENDVVKHSYPAGVWGAE